MLAFVMVLDRETATASRQTTCAMELAAACSVCTSLRSEVTGLGSTNTRWQRSWPKTGPCGASFCSAAFWQHEGGPSSASPGSEQQQQDSIPPGAKHTGFKTPLGQRHCTWGVPAKRVAAAVSHTSECNKAWRR